MANIVVNSNTNFVKVDFGIYALPKLIMHKSTILEACPFEGGLMVKTGSVRDNFTWYITWTSIPPLSNGTEFMIVDSINATAPTSNDNLLDLIYGL